MASVHQRAAMGAEMKRTSDGRAKVDGERDRLFPIQACNKA